MFNQLYHRWYSEARFESELDVLSNMSEQDLYAEEQLSYMDAPSLLPAGSVYDSENRYEDWAFGPNPMPSSVLC